MRGALTIVALLSVAVLPWQLSAALALLAGTMEPLVPLSCGLFAEALYWTPSAHPVPLFALSGLVATLVLYAVRGRVKASIIE